MDEARDPFPIAVRSLMSTAGLSFRGLERATKTTDPTGKGLSLGYLGQLARGQSRPTPDNMTLIARAADVDPRYFREYREHVAAEEARALVERVGLDAVLDALERAGRRRRPK